MSRKFLTNIDMNSNQLLNALAQVLGSDPGSPVEGQFWYDSTSKTLQFRSNSANIDLGRLDQITAPTAGVNFNGQQLLSALVELTTDPGSPADGRIWANTGSNATMKVRVNGVTYKLGRLDQINAPTASVDLNSQKITGLANGTAATDAVNKGQLDAAQSGLDVKQSVRVASTANVSGTYNATGGTSTRGQFTGMTDTIDDVALSANDRVLLKDQTLGARDGIWVVSTLGTGANGVWDRATDFDADAEVTAGAFTFVEEGTVNADTGWVLTTDNPIIIGGSSGTALAWTKFSAAPTGVQKYTETGPGSDGTTWVVTHGLGTSDVVVQVRAASGDLVVEPDIELTDANTVTLTSSATITASTLKVVVIG
jgi:Coiled stalk of trimeric autotransporter adhesin